MRIYYRDLNDWHKAGQVGKVGSYEIGLKKWCIEHIGPIGCGLWGTFRPPRSNIYTRAEGIEFLQDEYATAFLLVFK